MARMSYSVFFVLSVTLVSCSQAALYPSTYPYENNVNAIPDLPDSTPSFSFDDSDPGGYQLAGIRCDLNDPDFFDVWYADIYDFCGNGKHLLMKQYGVQNFAPSDFNCTSDDSITADKGFPYTIAGEVVCDHCCDMYYGQLTWGVPTDSINGATQTWDASSPAAGCATMNPSAYCNMVSGYLWLCLNRYVDAGTRLYTTGCFDGVYEFFKTCALYKSTGAQSAIVDEDSKIYMERLTPDESFVLGGLTYTYDRVCHPYSYYYPDLVGSGGDSPDSGGDDEGDDDAKGADDSAAVSAGVLFAVVGFSMLFL